MNKLKKGDEVIVLTGRDKGRRGKISKRVDENYLIVDGINVVKKHMRPNPMKSEPGGIVNKEMPIHQSNVAIFNPQTKKADRVRMKAQESGAMVRTFASSGESIGV